MSNQPVQTNSSSLGARPGASSAAPSEASLASYRLAAIVESADDAIVSKTLEGVVTSWNKGAERLFGYTADEMIGQHISRLIPSDHLDEEPQILARLRRGEKIEHYETVRVRKDGALRNISLTVSPIRDADGIVIGASKIARDITEQKAAQLRLQQALAEAENAKKEAEEANRLKDQFLSTISHELRTPLTAVMGWIAMLRADRLDEAMTMKALATIDRNVKAQAQLVEDLLDISRIVNGKMRIDPKPLNLSAIIHAAVDSIMPAAEAKALRLQVVIDPGTGTVVGDYDRLQQVIWNLLSNAVKFTPAGGRIQIQIERVDSQVELTVSDNGIGIKPDFLPHIFDRFTQEDSSTTRTHGGLGMGLAIVKYIMELHGGTVKVISEGEGKGSAFTIALPQAPKTTQAQRSDLRAISYGISSEPGYRRGHEPGYGTEETRHTTQKPHEKRAGFPPELDGLKIVVIDDEIDTCEMLSAAFAQCGSMVEIATSGSMALEQWKQWRPDVLICDINMPQMDGYQLIQQIRERELQEGTRTPAIALTALARIEDRVKVLKAGYQMHVPKPVELPELFTVVASLTSLLPDKA